MRKKTIVLDGVKLIYIITASDRILIEGFDGPIPVPGDMVELMDTDKEGNPIKRCFVVRNRIYAGDRKQKLALFSGLYADEIATVRQVEA